MAIGRAPLAIFVKSLVIISEATTLVERKKLKLNKKKKFLFPACALGLVRFAANMSHRRLLILSIFSFGRLFPHHPIGLTFYNNHLLLPHPTYMSRLGDVNSQHV